MGSRFFALIFSKNDRSRAVRRTVTPSHSLSFFSFIIVCGPVSTYVFPLIAKLINHILQMYIYKDNRIRSKYKLAKSTK